MWRGVVVFGLIWAFASTMVACGIGLIMWCANRMHEPMDEAEAWEEEDRR